MWSPELEEALGFVRQAGRAGLARFGFGHECSKPLAGNGPPSIKFELME